MFHEGREGDSEGDGGFVAGVVDEIDGSGLGHEVEGGDEDDEESGGEDLEEIEVEGLKHLDELLGSDTEDFERYGGHDWDE